MVLRRTDIVFLRHLPLFTGSLYAGFFGKVVDAKQTSRDFQLAGSAGDDIAKEISLGVNRLQRWVVSSTQIRQLTS